ncbi:MAG: flagellin [Tepidisphaeraceae bacterium]
MAQRTARLNSLALSRSMQRLATGRRINRGADDPAGLIASEQLNATLAHLDAETRANERTHSIASTADGALSEVSGLLTEAKRLQTANANDAGLRAEEKSANQMQIDSILSTVDRISNTTSFNGQKLLTGTATLSSSGKSMTINGTSTASIGDVTIDGTAYTLSDVKTGGRLEGNAQGAAQSIDAAIKQVSTLRGKIGAFDKYTVQSRIRTIASSREQITSAVSMIRDTDYAAETSANMRYQLLQAVSMRTLKMASQRRRSTFSILA